MLGGGHRAHGHFDALALTNQLRRRLASPLRAVHLIRFRVPLVAGPNLPEGRDVNLFRLAPRAFVILMWGILQLGGSAFAVDDSAPLRTAIDGSGSQRTSKLRINWVSGINNGHVESDVSGVLKCSDPTLLRDLEFYASHHLPASVAFDEATRQITAVTSAPVDLLLAVSDPDPASPWVSVQLLKRPTLLRLSRSNDRFAELLSLLRDAANRKVPVAIGLRPAGNEIQDVRVDIHP
jgi:hypothetical protein